MRTINDCEGDITPSIIFAHAVVQLIKSLYEGKLCFKSENEALRFFHLADFLQIDQIKDKSCSYIYENISNDFLIQIWSLGTDFHEKCKNFMESSEHFDPRYIYQRRKRLPKKPNLLKNKIDKIA